MRRADRLFKIVHYLQGRRLTTAAQLAQYQAFFEPLKSQKALTRVIEMGISEIKARVELIESDAPGVRSALLNK